MHRTYTHTHLWKKRSPLGSTASGAVGVRSWLFLNQDTWAAGRLCGGRQVTVTFCPLFTVWFTGCCSKLQAISGNTACVCCFKYICVSSMCVVVFLQSFVKSFWQQSFYKLNIWLDLKIMFWMADFRLICQACQEEEADCVNIMFIHWRIDLNLTKPWIQRAAACYKVLR